MTGYGCCCRRGIITLFGAQLLELLESGFLCWGEMADMTFEPRFSVGSFWGRRADGASVFVTSDHIVFAVNKVDGAFEEVAVYVCMLGGKDSDAA